MEKTKLVRTFGTALATATLSFGLFVPTAFADAKTVEVESDDAIIVVGNDDDDIAKVGDKVTIEIPCTITGVDSFNEDDSTLTFKASDGTFEQEYTLKYAELAPGKKQADPGTFGFHLSREGLGQQIITKIYATIEVDDAMLSGVWSFDELKLVEVNGGDDVEIKGIDASFLVDDTDGPDYLAVDLESITVLRSVVSRTRDQMLFVNGKQSLFTESPTEATATYVNPAGVEKDYDLTRMGETNRLASDPLPTGVEGDYCLTKLTIKRAESDVLTTSVVYDDIDLLDQGDYVVTKTGVEAMIRLYNPWTGEHIYTNDGVEQIAAVAAGWVYEGLAWYAPVNGLYQGAVAPVYRVYNQYNGEHHYTTSSVEALALVAAGWTDEGVGFYTTTKGDSLAQPVYRLFNPFATVGTHHYTIGEDEYNALQLVGWKGEGVGWYGVKPFGDLIDED